MKKRNFLSIFAALAIAASCVLTPQSPKSSLDVVASAADTQSALNGGGITLTKVGKTGDAVKTTDNTYLNLLGAESVVQLNINIPKINKLVDSFTLRVYYDSDVFSVTRWYWDASHDMWPDAFSSLGGSTTGNASCSNGVLTLTYSSDGNAGGRLDLTNGVSLNAIFTVNENTSGSDFKFYVITENTFMTCYDGEGNPLLDDNGNNIVRAYGEVDGLEDDHKYTSFESVDSYDHTIYNWNPASYDKNPATNNFYIEGKIKNKTTCTLTGIDPDYLDDTTLKYTQYVKNPLMITVWEPEPGTEQSVSENYWRKDYDVESYTKQFGSAVDVDENGNFVITGLTPGNKYYLSINCWGKFKVSGSSGTVLRTYCEITAPEENQDLSSGIVFWMFGDADENGKVNTNDATQILKYIVGTNSSISYGNNRYSMGNVLDADELNARDATQILRYTAFKDNIFQKNEPYTP